jgi:protein-S-isoprenylcysteine O-methyltransferase Ste14
LWHAETMPKALVRRPPLAYSRDNSADRCAGWGKDWMVKLGGAPTRSLTLERWLSSTPRRTFVFYPLVIAFAELLWRGGLIIHWVGIPVLALGYLQYRWSGVYRTQHGGSGPGVAKPPIRLVTTGIYLPLHAQSYVFGASHFMLSLTITFASIVAAALLAFHVGWFHRRALEVETHMRRIFGAVYGEYAHRVRRWGVI